MPAASLGAALVSRRHELPPLRLEAHRLRAARARRRASLRRRRRRGRGRPDARFQAGALTATRRLAALRLPPAGQLAASSAAVRPNTSAVARPLAYPPVDQPPAPTPPPAKPGRGSP